MEYYALMRKNEVYLHATPHNYNFEQKKPDIRVCTIVFHVYEVQK